MADLYTNSSSKQDFIRHGLITSVEDGMDVFIASAFFTESSVIDELVQKGCHIRIVVRLGFPTLPAALEKLLSHDKVEARFFTSNSFHPKFYIFGDKKVLLGSANLTRSALLSNQEVMVSLQSDDHRFDELKSLFSDYWEEASVLTKDAIKDYRSIYNKLGKLDSLVKQLDDSVTDTLGDKNFSNISRGKKKTNRKSIFQDTYYKSYQESVYAFRCIEEVYSTFERKIDESNIPLRLEIDSFFSFVRDKHATTDIWKRQPIGWTESQKLHIRDLIDEWLTIHWKHFEDKIVPTNYPLILRVFGSVQSIQTASMHDIVEALCVLHSFHDRFRFYKGGLPTLKTAFIEANDESQVKKTLCYLLYGTGDIVTRMSNCIHDSEYELNEFGPANVQELIGWINKENLPVINGRTTKVLRYFGFEVKQLGD
ncbi:alcohol dehydrogenase [Vibrio navarrensis]|uniref:phospholipase D-like domain-containing protein n=1 Tax=Vibrio navarrensis TaxID=29495 RepID=UPI0018687547|nr:phospholipase D family protein [Vibrio navarrensis]MBE3659223.1 alcohol dehydrogenase [Vibrio navarrensis]